MATPIETPPNSLQRRLTPRQLAMMALGSAIGTGLFVGSGKAISVAGPAVLITYVVSGVLVLLLLMMLAEMVAASPDSGAFSTFAQRAMGAVAGSTTGWLYWVAIVLVVPAEAIGAAGILYAVFPSINVALWAALFIVALALLNLLGVHRFGQFEFWFALIKIVVIVGFIVVGALMLLGLFPGVHSPGLSNFTANGGFFPTGVNGVSASVLLVVFTFAGTEIVAIAAAETADPARNISRAVRSVIWRITAFYVGSVFFIVALVPWNDKDVAASPFTAVLALAHIPGASSIMAAVIVIALLSSANANLYGASRMLYSLSQRRTAPRFLSLTNRSGVPRAAVAASILPSILALLAVTFGVDSVFVGLLNAVGATSVVLWIIIVISQIVLRRRADRDGTPLPYRVRLFPAVPIIALVLLAIIVILTIVTPGARDQLIQTVILTGVIAAISAIVFSLRRRGQQRTVQDVSESTPVNR